MISSRFFNYRDSPLQRPAHSPAVVVVVVKVGVLVWVVVVVDVTDAL